MLRNPKYIILVHFRWMEDQPWTCVFSCVWEGCWIVAIVARRITVAQSARMFMLDTADYETANERRNKRTNTRTRERTSAQECTHTAHEAHERTYKRTKERTSERTHKSTDERTNEPTNERANGRRNVRAGRRKWKIYSSSRLSCYLFYHSHSTSIIDVQKSFPFG